MAQVEKRLADTGSLLSVPGIIGGGKAGSHEFATFTEFVLAMSCNNKDMRLDFKSADDKIFAIEN